jgi:hypothetical protein
MRKIVSWWLSAFYSFCIQSRVRKVLSLIESLRPKRHDAHLTSTYYLHRVVRLFIASSGVHDPLPQNYPDEVPSGLTEEAISYIENIMIAQAAVERDGWASAGIKSSEDYLRLIFEDDGKGEIPAPETLPNDLV